MFFHLLKIWNAVVNTVYNTRYNTQFVVFMWSSQLAAIISINGTDRLFYIECVEFNITHFESRITHLLYTAINTTEHG
jgi:hypothetical protein